MDDRNAIFKKLRNFEKKYDLNKGSEIDQADLLKMKYKVIVKLINNGNI